MRVASLPKDAVLIRGSVTDYIDQRGNVYSINTKPNQQTYFFKKEQSTIFGYKYCTIKYRNKDGSSRNTTKRVHRLVAEAFIPNPNGYPIVMHIDNNKTNNVVSNLKWGTISENTKQAFDDGLAVNDKGWDDSQSNPCDAYETINNKLIRSYGSRTEASKDTGITIGTITAQCEGNAPIRKKIYFTNHGTGPKDHYIIIQYNYDSDEEVARFPNCGSASRDTGVSESAIGRQVNLNCKPKHRLSETYFLRVLLKCEETIESEK